jgi:hypothetical protein
MKDTCSTFKTALMIAVPAVLLANNASGAAVGIDPKTAVTASMDGGTAKTGNTWYEVGVNTAAATTGFKTGLVSGQNDPLSSYLFRSSVGANALMLDNSTKTGTLTFSQPLKLSGLSFAGASGNGAGTITATLHFTDSSTSALAPLAVGDWFNNTNRVETVAGSIDLVANTFNNVAADNPRVLSANLSLSATDAAKTISSIDLSWTGGATTHTMIFGVSGDLLGLGHYSAIQLDGSSFNQDVIVGTAEAIPEPGTMALLGLGVFGLAAAYRKKNS